MYHNEIIEGDPLCGFEIASDSPPYKGSRGEGIAKIIPSKGQEIKKAGLSEDEHIKFSSLAGVGRFPMRVKCATLSWHTLKAALDDEKKPINSEIID